MTMKIESHMNRLLAVTFSALLLAGPAGADDQTAAEEDRPATLAEALADGPAAVDLRYRFELVLDDAPAVSGKDAAASTLRVTVSYGSRPYRGFSFFVEAENVTVAGNEDLFRNAGAGSLANGVTDRPVVADPEITEINQAVVNLELGKTAFHVGRREILLGNHRFVGNVGWRQNHQSFDSLSIVDRSLPSTTLGYHYVDAVHRIFGDDKPMSSHLFHGETRIADSGKLSYYAYSLDYDRPADAALSTETFGLRYEAGHPFGRRRLTYAVEAAEQRDGGDNPLRVAAGYYLAEVGAGTSAVTVKAGLEVLEGSPGDGKFTTPLATLHKFQGWADKFLATPVNGIEDLYLSLSGSAGDFRWSVIYHDFSASEGGADYGTELDLLALYKTNWNQTFGLKAALYDAESHAADTDKIMFFTAYRFGR